MKEDWAVVRLGDVLRRVKNERTVEDDSVYARLTIRMNGRGIVVRDRVLGHEIGTKRQFVARTGQLVLSKIDARNGAFGILSRDGDNSIITGNFWAFDVDKERLLPAYFDYLTKTPLFLEFCVRASEGTTNRRYLQEDQFLAQEISLPTWPEQRRIVARIDALAAKICGVRAVRQQVKEEADALSYSAVRMIRHRLISSSHPKAKLGTLTRVTSGGTPSRANPGFWNGNIAWVKTGELVDGDISHSEERITQAGVDNSSAKVFPPGTVLVALYGQGQTRGRTGRLLIPAATNQACCAILPNPDRFESRYVQFWLRSLYLELREDAKGGAQPNWNGGLIKALEVALPPPPEQRRVVAYLDDIQERVVALRAIQAEASAEIDALMPSILDKAFRGEL
jgi:type I restriction enzyme, S subunit